jgi:alpha-amylase/alpha-mannosidase (GH57 family)
VKRRSTPEAHARICPGVGDTCRPISGHKEFIADNMPQIRLMLLWHMHQPYYKDLNENRYTMPWVRLHALKDYYGMVAILREFPAVHVTFNLVPSLISQLLDYANGAAHEESYALALKPAADLDAREKATLLHYAFQVNRENLLARYPRFVELYEKAKAGGDEPSVAPISEVQEIRDIQVLSQLVWFDEIYLAQDSEVKSLVEKQRWYSEEDKLTVRNKETEILKQTLEEYRQAAERGQIEISTSPFYHPILPLICDTNSGAESCPGLHLPLRRFCHPEDARDQLKAAIKLHERVFGQKPRGLWPSEGSISETALRLAAEEGFRWTATDEGVLGRSLRTWFHRYADGAAHDGNRLYQPYRFVAGGLPIALFFRDHPLSDLIGFVYHRMDAKTAAEDLIGRIRSAARSAGDRPAVVSIILDGENAWEYYPGNGREFLKQFYSLLASQPDIQTVTPSEILADSNPDELRSITPGSWINANFNVWIGAEEDNRAWDLLSDARDFFSSHCEDPGVSPKSADMARHELWISEGSDWCWWYGPEHSTANDEEFDRLYRQHLGNIYRLLGGNVPDELALPIKRPKCDGQNMPPSALINPVIDGRETTYFEWMGAGIYIPDARSAAIHESRQYVDELHYGCGDTRIYLKLDFKHDFTASQKEFGVRVSLGDQNPWRIQALIAQGRLDRIELWRDDEPLGPRSADPDIVQAAYESVLEMGIDFSALRVEPQREIPFQISLWLNQLPVQVMPREGFLTIAMTDELVAW